MSPPPLAPRAPAGARVPRLRPALAGVAAAVVVATVVAVAARLLGPRPAPEHAGAARRDASPIGKRVLVDVTEYDRDLRVRLRADFVGVVVGAGGGVVRVRRDDTGAVVALRAGPDALEPAPPGEYHLAGGAPVAAPDLLARWAHYDELPGHAAVTVTYDLGPDGTGRRGPAGGPRPGASE